MINYKYLGYTFVILNTKNRFFMNFEDLDTRGIF